MNLALVKSENFGNVQCDFWKDENNEIYMTREQIGGSLEYADPNNAIKNIHRRNQERLDKFSGRVKLSHPSGGVQETVVYNTRGIYEVIRFSKQPKANAFFDFVYTLLEGLRKGDFAIITVKKQELEVKRMNAEARLINAKVRQAKLIIQSNDGKILSPQSVELLNINAIETLIDKPIGYRPEIEKTYTATDLANEFGVSSQKIGRLANAHNIKTEEYGIQVLDKAKHIDKQVPSFRYNEKGRQKLKEIIQEQ
jgi:prophage antirepressor-like protein